jgi:hypothetical protein
MEASLDVTDQVRLLATEVEETGWSVDLIPVSAPDRVCLRIARPSPQSGPDGLQVLELCRRDIAAAIWSARSHITTLT